jgi:hypothetical protein
VCSYTSAWQWRAQWCTVISLRATEWHIGWPLCLRIFEGHCGVQLYFCVSLKESVICVYMSACHWKTQCFAVTCVRDTEALSGVKLFVCVSLEYLVVCNYRSSRHWGPSGVLLYVCMPLYDTVVCSYMSGCPWRKLRCAITCLHDTKGINCVQF